MLRLDHLVRACARARACVRACVSVYLAGDAEELDEAVGVGRAVGRRRADRRRQQPYKVGRPPRREQLGRADGYHAALARHALYPMPGGPCLCTCPYTCLCLMIIVGAHPNDSTVGLSLPEVSMLLIPKNARRC